MHGPITGLARQLVLAGFLALGLPSGALGDAETLTERALEPWKGDLDGMIERGFIRIAVPHNPLFLAFDKDKTVGLAAERAYQLEKFIEETLGEQVDAVILPTPRDRLLPALVEGRADFADANLTITAERAKIVAFTDPLRENVSEIVVTGPLLGEISSYDELVAPGLNLRLSSSYAHHLEKLNEVRRIAKQPEIPLFEVDEAMEDYDLMELVDSGNLPAIIVDDHKAKLWAKVFDHVILHPNLSLGAGGSTALALRQDSPQLLELLNGFVANVRSGTLLGNILDQKYLDSSRWIEQIHLNRKSKDVKRIVSAIKLYSGEYDLDWVTMLAQAYQESKLDPNARSSAGAVGVMQLLPSTASDPNVGIDNITKIEPNVEAAARYLRFLQDQYFDDPKIDRFNRTLLSLAAYNAGPGAVNKARTRAEGLGLDSNRWFDNVEVATSQTVGREPIVYVRNIFKYAVALQRSEELKDFD